MSVAEDYEFVLLGGLPVPRWLDSERAGWLWARLRSRGLIRARLRVGR